VTYHLASKDYHSQHTFYTARVYLLALLQNRDNIFLKTNQPLAAYNLYNDECPSQPDDPAPAATSSHLSDTLY
jgi:hypothetical protein